MHLQGFGLEDTHSVASSLNWGPDGWLYGAQGSTVSAAVLRPGIDQGDADAVKSMGQNVWRYHPERKIYEVFAEGGRQYFRRRNRLARARLFWAQRGRHARVPLRARGVLPEDFRQTW